MKKYVAILGVILTWFIARVPALANGLSIPEPVNYSTIPGGLPFEWYENTFRFGSSSISLEVLLGLVSIGAIYCLAFKYPSRFMVAVVALITSLSLAQVIIPSYIPGNSDALIDPNGISLWAYFLSPAGALFQELAIKPSWNFYGLTSLILILLSAYAGFKVWHIYRNSRHT